jgi:hypothetical protein
MDNPIDSARLRESFYRWQCQSRKEIMRAKGGVPSPAIRPRVTDAAGREIASAITVLLVESAPDATTDTLRNMVRKTPDPRERYESAVRFLSAAYYQDARNFDDLLTALFAAGSRTGAALKAAGRCVLHFAQGNVRYRVPCDVVDLQPPNPAFQAAYWHNRLFNPRPPPEVLILGFRPDWPAAAAE